MSKTKTMETIKEIDRCLKEIQGLEYNHKERMFGYIENHTCIYIPDMCEEFNISKKIAHKAIEEYRRHIDGHR